MNAVEHRETDRRPKLLVLAYSMVGSSRTRRQSKESRGLLDIAKRCSRFLLRTPEYEKMVVISS
jgi:hypothetical protein